MKRIRYIVTTLLIGAALLFGPAVGFVAADPPADSSGSSAGYQDACAGIGLAGGDCDATKAGGSINTLLQTIVNILTGIVGVVAVIMIVISGFKYITSGGDSTKIAGAKNTIIYAVIGLVVVALAQIIVHFVIHTAAGATSPTPPSHSAHASST